MNKPLYVIALIALLALSCTLRAPDGMQTPTETAEAPNEEPTQSEETTALSGAQKGDLVAVNFILTLENGTVVDTNNLELAEKYGIDDYVKGPYKFILGQSGKLPGFDNAIIGMNVNDTKEAKIEPIEPELIMEINKTRFINRIIPVPRYQGFSKSNFEELFGRKPSIGAIVQNTDKFPFKYQIVNMSNKTVIGKMLIKENETYTLANSQWESKVIKVANEDALFAGMPIDGQNLSTPFGQAKVFLGRSTLAIQYNPELHAIYNQSIDIGKGHSIPQQFEVIEIKDTSFIIKRYGALTDKKLQLTVQILELTQGVKEVRDEKHKIVEVSM